MVMDGPVAAPHFVLFCSVALVRHGIRVCLVGSLLSLETHLPGRTHSEVSQMVVDRERPFVLVGRCQPLAQVCALRSERGLSTLLWMGLWVL